MSAQLRRKQRRNPVLVDRAGSLDLWWRIVDIRTEWLSHALSTAPAERATAERAVTKLYALLGQPPPRFEWVPSPAAASELLPSAPVALRTGMRWSFASRLATEVLALRERLDRRIGADRGGFDPIALPTADPVAELSSGATLRSIVDIGVRQVLRRIVRESVADVVRSAADDLPALGWLGQHDANWVAEYDVHRRVLGARFTPADDEQLDLWAALARATGWWWPRDDVCVLAERPALLRAAPVPGSAYDELRLHADDGPAVLFRDGFAMHSWHGTRVPSWVIDSPTVERIANERNVEVRRCAIERIGWGAFVDGAGLTLVARAADPGNPDAHLELYDLPYDRWGASSRLLLAVNGSRERDGTRRRYGLRVPPDLDDPLAAAGWSYGLDGAQYAHLQRRT